MKYDVIIIGSGLGGLECGSLLSRAGRSVLVLERGPQTGGCLQSYRRSGLTFDTGFHYVGGLTEGQPLHSAFSQLGLLDLPWQRMNLDGFDRITIGDRTFPLAQGYDAFAERLAEDFPAEREALKRYVDLLRRSSNGVLDIMDASNCDLMETSAWQYLNENFRDPLLINVLSGNALRMELRQESLPLFAFLHANGSFIESSWRLKGEGSQITNKLASDIRAQGGEIVCNAEVLELVEKDGQLVAAVCSNGETYEGCLFISNVHPALTCSLVKQSSRIKPAYRRRIHSLENTFGMFTLSLSLPPQTVRYSDYNRYIYRQPNVWNFWRESGPVGGVLVSCRVPDDGSGYTRQIDLLTPMPWERCKEWSDTKLGIRGDEYKLLKERLAEECIALAEPFLPGLRSASQSYTSTPLTWRDYTLTPEGSAYGIRKDYRNPMLTMLSPKTPIPNLFLTGQNLALHGLQGVTMTALRTCNEITRTNC